MDRIIDIYEANSIVNEFYVLTKDQFITNGVKIEQKTYSDKQRGDYLNIKEHKDNDDFYCCEIHLKIVYKQKSIDVYFIIYSNHNFYSDNNIYIRNYIVSNSSNYKFDLHDYVVNRYGMFKEYKEDWKYDGNYVKAIKLMEVKDAIVLKDEIKWIYFEVFKEHFDECYYSYSFEINNSHIQEDKSFNKQMSEIKNKS